MSMNDGLANAMSHIKNCERNAKSVCHVKPASRVLKGVMEIFRDEGYIGAYREIADGRGNILELNLLGKLNNCGVIKPRSAIKKDQFEKFEKRHLPAQGFGIIVISTNKGIMTHSKAKKLGLGGKLIAYCY